MRRVARLAHKLARTYLFSQCIGRLTGRAVPAREGHVVVLEAGSLYAVDEGAPHAELADDLVQRAAADEELLGRVREAVERRADEHEDVALGAAQRGPVLVRELVRGDEHTQAPNADEDTLCDRARLGTSTRKGEDCTHDELCPVVLGAHVYPAEEQAYGNGPRVEEHAREERGVLVRFDDQEVSFDVARCEDEV